MTSFLSKRGWLTAIMVITSLTCLSPIRTFADDKDEKSDDVANKAMAPVPTAVVTFQDRGGKDNKLTGAKVTDLLFAELVAKPEMFLVDREELSKTLAEHELNLSGAVNPDQAIQVGQLTGAKVIVTGSVVTVESNLYLVAKIIGTETTRVLGASVKGKVDDEVGRMVEKLAEQIAETITTKSDQLIAKAAKKEDRVAALQKMLGNKKRPSIVVSVKERHLMQSVIDPAAQTELEWYLKETDFPVVDRTEGDKSDADILLVGEGFSEFGGRFGNLASVKARLEVKAIDRRTGRVLAVDRQATVTFDLTEQIACKTALQDAAARIAERLLPKVVEPESAKKGKKK